MPFIFKIFADANCAVPWWVILFICLSGFCNGMPLVKQRLHAFKAKLRCECRSAFVVFRAASLLKRCGIAKDNCVAKFSLQLQVYSAGKNIFARVFLLLLADSKNA